MNTFAATALQKTVAHEGGMARLLANLLAGVTASLAIFLVLSFARKVTVEPPVAPVVSLQRVSAPEVPPPQPEMLRSDVAAANLIPFPTPVQGRSMLTPSPSDSLIVVRAALPAMGPVIEPAPVPTATFTPGQFRPTGALALDDPRQVFNQADVDQPAVVLYRKIPEVSRSLYESVRNPRARVMMLVETDGKVSKAWLVRSSNHEEFDALVIEALLEWEFRPAVKRGKNVRCWVVQPVYVKLPGSNPFQL